MIKKFEIMNAVKEDKLFDFVATHYWQMNKEDLVDIIKELDYAIYRLKYREPEVYADTMEEFTGNLYEWWEDEIAEELEEENSKSEIQVLTFEIEYAIIDSVNRKERLN